MISKHVMKIVSESASPTCIALMVDYIQDDARYVGCEIYGHRIGKDTTYIIFKTEEDLNLYLLVGNHKENDRLKFCIAGEEPWK
jgi:hypothetical protein